MSGYLKNPKKTAVIICDMWDNHWCKGAAARVVEMASRMNDLLNYLRDIGCVIIHCPSDTMTYYKNYPQRKKILELAADGVLNVNETNRLKIENLPPLYVDMKRVECDCGDDKCPQCQPWSKQIETLAIKDTDLIGDNDEVLKALNTMGIEQIIMMGVHTNLCVLHRRFAIKNLITHDYNVVLVRDMTDCMAPSDEPPYINHFDALSVVVSYIEQQLCPTVTSGELMGDGKIFTFAEDKKKHRFDYEK
jgi:Amidases related to nicotinamidase